jgi:hypothetical protein
LELKQRGRKVSGTIEGQGRQGDVYREKLRGRIEEESYVTLSFRSSVKGMLDYGVGVLHIHGTGRQMDIWGIARHIRVPRVILVTGSLEKRQG